MKMRITLLLRPGLVADRIESLVGIPPEGKRRNPPPGPVPLRDFEKPESKLCERLAGILVERPEGMDESIMACQIGRQILNRIDDRDLGFVSGPGGMYQLFPGRARGPDVAFFPRERFPNGERPTAAGPSEFTAGRPTGNPSAGDVLPGFVLNLEDLFANLDKRRKK